MKLLQKLRNLVLYNIWTDCEHLHLRDGRNSHMICIDCGLEFTGAEIEHMDIQNGRRIK